ncbi:hypothetical protein ROJ8625_00934 [Roseivivax jejudonensis]|uniref:DNA primase/polymerase bifunctional N-terminal domain-containing protein n=1 Tax=Roseivivax jejudonensis TaxID=1529041 RepID=A0A1X6YJW9_9RHOB|nr:bifunctional DNA primase/polymerase [Roseivivax jejudonensis]SLN23300.1 hypothetical protein ROJ8625_00934 [Roseivivax jejudonensis]
MEARKLHFSGPPADAMARLHSAGFSLLPLGAGDDGKSPLVKFGATDRLPLKRVLAPMHRTGSACFGIRLDGLAVIDCDTDDPGLVEAMEARFGASSVHVRTPRGRHLYYRAEGGAFPNLRKEGLPVDIKRGATSYVAGPGSVRPDGGRYEPAKGALGLDDLPALRQSTGGAASKGASSRIPSKPIGSRIETGGRNYTLTLAAIQMVESVDDTDELFGNLQFLRDDECEDPATVPDRELRKIAEWAWSKRLEGNVFMGRNSEFRINRQALDALQVLPNSVDAIALFVTLQAVHGHTPGKTFALNHAAMRAAGHIDLSRERFNAARTALARVGLLETACKHRAGHHARSYRLCRLHPAMFYASNVSRLRLASGGAGKEGEEV